jgi:hypothetical protein
VIATTWRRAALAPGRIDLRLRPGPSAAAALAIYRPLRRRSMAAAHINRALLAAGLWRQTGEPVEGLEDLARTISLDPDSIATMTSSARDRLIVGFAAQGRLEAVAKVGLVDDVGLRREGRVLARLQAATPSRFEIPRLRWHGTWHDRYVVAVEAATMATAPTSLEDAREVAVELATGAGDEESLTHGDFAPWNLVRTPTGLLLMDWEEARTPCEPLVDLAQFIVQSGCLLGAVPPATAVALLTAPGGPGWVYLEATGRSPADAPAILRAALSGRAPGSETPIGQTFRQAMQTVLNRSQTAAIA